MKPLHISALIISFITVLVLTNFIFKNSMAISCIVIKHDSALINNVYGIYAANYKSLYKVCKKNDPNNKNVPSVVSILYGPDNHTKNASPTYKNINFRMDIGNCEDIPKHSVCINPHYCFIKYREE